MSKSPQPYICVLDDDPLIYRYIGKVLGISCLPFKSTDTLLARSESLEPVAAFIDIHLGAGKSGISVLKDLQKQWPRTALIVITCDQSEHLIGESLAAGAHDFLYKPLRKAELLARFKARSQEVGRLYGRDTLEVGSFQIRRHDRVLSGPSGSVVLTQQECTAIEFLVCQMGILTPKPEFKYAIWGNLAVSDNSVDQLIVKLRRAIKGVAATAKIKLVYGKGLSLESFGGT